jgi:hypothetical protein
MLLNATQKRLMSMRKSAEMKPKAESMQFDVMVSDRLFCMEGWSLCHLT